MKHLSIKLLNLKVGTIKLKLDALISNHPRFAYFALALFFLGISSLIARNLLFEGLPPGVDSPTFLHMAWFTKETLLGHGGLTDPYWYGGFSIFSIYPPVGYGIVGVIASIPGIGFILTYKIVLLIAYSAIGTTTYCIARRLDNGFSLSLLAGLVAILAYPVQASVGLWGWYSTIVALPLALLSLILLEKAHDGNRAITAVLGGSVLGLSVLSHHMTAFAFGIFLPIWLIYHFLTKPDLVNHLFKVSILFVLGVTITTIWWIIPWATSLLEYGFEREIPGIWSFSLHRYFKASLDVELIGSHIYPSYIGLGLIFMAVGGLIHTLTNVSRTTPYAILLLLIIALSLGEAVNPIVKLWPFSSLDVARFQVFMTPLIAVVGLPFLKNAAKTITSLVALVVKKNLRTSLATGLIIALIAGPMALDSSVTSSKIFKPYLITPDAQAAFNWLGEEGREGKVLGVGSWHWHTFLMPYILGRSVVDGWHDEGAKNWQKIRALRTMMWTGDVDAARAHSILKELDGRYVVIENRHPGESPKDFKNALLTKRNLFNQVADLNKVSIFEVL
ncbi:MAG: putative membrane protein [Chloroflexi bacterium]|jgi:hypothetical protein|nr:MAG: putative membrane protein [Chloroflexota bacterium]